MNMTTQRAIVAAIAVLICRAAYAPLFGSYPGLGSLIKEADVIAVVTIGAQLSEPDFGGFARYKIGVNRVFKGTISDKTLVANLRHLALFPDDYRTPAAASTPAAVVRYFGFTERFDPFIPSSRWVVFLAKPRPDIDASYENVNCSGSTIPLSPLTDVDALKVESLPETLVQLFREYVDYKRTELDEWNEQLRVFIHQPDEPIGKP